MATRKMSCVVETDTRFAIGTKGKHQIDKDVFVYIDRGSPNPHYVLLIRRVVEKLTGKTNVFG